MADKTKITRQYRLSPDIVKALEEHSAASGKTMTAIIEAALIQYFDKEGIINNLADQIIEKYDEKYKNYMTRVRLASREADINSQVIIELLNMCLIHDKYRKDDFAMTDILENPALTAAKSGVKARIAKYKQEKDSRGSE